MSNKPHKQQPPQNQPEDALGIVSGTISHMDGLPGEEAQIDAGDPQFEPVRRVGVDELLDSLPPGLSPKELEQLAAGILKKAGHAGKTPTGKHVARHAFLRDILDEHSGKPIRVAPGTVLDDLTREEIAHLTKHKAIEPEYA